MTTKSRKKSPFMRRGKAKASARQRGLLLFERLESRELLDADATFAPLDEPAMEESVQIMEANDRNTSDLAGYVQVDRLSSNLFDIVRSEKWRSEGLIGPIVDDPGELMSRTRTDDDGQLAIETAIYLDDWSDEMLQSLEDLGVQQNAGGKEIGFLEAWVPATSLASVTNLSGVRFIDNPSYNFTRTGSVNTAADAVMRSDTLRLQYNSLDVFGLTGQGARVGVISDGAYYWQIVGDNLTGVTVNPALNGFGVEGTAMMEIIYDIAPGAQFFFSSAPTVADHINAVDWLISQNVHIIVDDLDSYAVPYFSDGVGATKVASVVANNNVMYVMAAGNDAQRHYQGGWTPSGIRHDFDPGTGIDTRLNATVPANTTAQYYLQWSDTWAGSANDFDLYLVDASTGATLASSTSYQTGTQNPFESIQWTNALGTPRNVAIEIRSFGTVAWRQLELYSANIDFTDPLRTSSDSIFGKAAVNSAISVGAANVNTPTTIEPFSSQGPSTILADPINQLFSQRSSLDVVSYDNVQTRIGQLGYFSNPFFGTSAAAPHIGGVLALMRQAYAALPLTPARYEELLKNKAIDTGPVGYDHTWGSGRVDAYLTVTPYQNARSEARKRDVNNDGYLTQMDYLQITNRLNTYGPGPLPRPTNAARPPYVDVNGDQYITTQDAVNVLNCLNDPLCNPGGPLP